MYWKSSEKLQNSSEQERSDDDDYDDDDFFFMGRQPLVSLGLLVFEVSRLHSDIPHSVGLLWTRDRPVARPLPDNTLHSQERDIHAPGGLRIRNRSK
jgi:hypothetical protein